MLKTIIRRSLDAFERRWNYDVGYMREILDEAGPDAVIPLNALQKLSNYRKNVPASVYCAAKLAASVAADCGPCAQLGVSMAEAEGIPAQTIRAIVTGDRDALSADERAAYDVARATMAREDATEAREHILKKYGRAGLVSLGYGIVVAEAYPTFKYAIGHGHTCVRLRVSGVDTILPKQHAVAV